MSLDAKGSRSRPGAPWRGQPAGTGRPYRPAAERRRPGPGRASADSYQDLAGFHFDLVPEGSPAHLRPDVAPTPGVPLPAVPGTHDRAALDHTLAERTSKVRTLVVQGVELAVEVHQHNVAVIGHDHLHGALCEVGSGVDPDETHAPGGSSPPGLGDGLVLLGVLELLEQLRGRHGRRRRVADRVGDLAHEL